MKKYGGIVLFAAVFLIAAMGFYDGHAKAAEKNITLYNGSSDANDWEDGDIYHVGDYGKIELQMNWYGGRRREFSDCRWRKDFYYGKRLGCCRK